MAATSNISRFDPGRKTVGAIYQDIAAKNTDEFVIAGDMSHELIKSFCDDLNATVASHPFDMEEFYITVYEKKDLQMKRTILRRLYTSKYRPYPEDDTVVFHVNPKNNHVRFCWCLPHHSEMDNTLMMFAEYSKEYIDDIRAWKNVNLRHFGFDRIGKTLVPSISNRDKPLNFSEVALKMS